MKEIYPSLWIGSAEDFKAVIESADSIDWAIVHAAKEPWHREAVGYSSKGAPEGPERLVARRGRRLALNLVDSVEVLFGGIVPMIAGAEFITEHVYKREVLVHCNQGVSRAPSLGLFWLHWHADPYIRLSFDAAELAFQGIYQDYAPSDGIRQLIKEYWQ